MSAASGCGGREGIRHVCCLVMQKHVKTALAHCCILLPYVHAVGARCSADGCTADVAELCCQQVNYNYDEYDKTIKDAIRGGRNELLLVSTRPQKDWSRSASCKACLSNA